MEQKLPPSNYPRLPNRPQMRVVMLGNVVVMSNLAISKASNQTWLWWKSYMFLHHNQWVWFLALAWIPSSWNDRVVKGIFHYPPIWNPNSPYTSSKPWYHIPTWKGAKSCPMQWQIWSEWSICWESFLVLRYFVLVLAPPPEHDLDLVANALYPPRLPSALVEKFLGAEQRKNLIYPRGVSPHSFLGKQLHRYSQHKERKRMANVNVSLFGLFSPRRYCWLISILLVILICFSVSWSVVYPWVSCVAFICTTIN